MSTSALSNSAAVTHTLPGARPRQKKRLTLMQIMFATDLQTASGNSIFSLFVAEMARGLFRRLPNLCNLIENLNRWHISMAYNLHAILQLGLSKALK